MLVQYDSMNSKVTLFIISLATFCLTAQGRNSKNLIKFSFTPQYYFTKNYIETDDKSPDPLSTKNTVGYNIGLTYQRKIKWGLFACYEIQYGYQENIVNIYYDLSNFDPGYESLKGLTLDKQYDLRCGFMNHRIMLGYEYQFRNKMLKGWAIEAKVGTGIKLFSKSLQSQSGGYIVEYYNNDFTVLKQRQFYLADANLGNSKWKLNPLANSFLQTYELSISMNRQVNYHFVKNISIGLDFATIIKTLDGPQQFIIKSYDNNAKLISKDHYYNKNTVLGLTIGVGLWK